MKVLFPYIAQLHQVFHSLPIASELAMRYPQIDVRVAGVTERHVDFVRRSLDRHAPLAPVKVERLAPVVLTRVKWRRKRRLLLRNWLYLRSFDAIVTPERTSLFLRRLGLGRTQLIWSGHGAGDRAIGFADDIHQFDYVLMSGAKIEKRLLEAGQIRPGHYSCGVYPKFDWVRAHPPQRLFDNDRPVVLYVPHFRDELSSWTRMGRAVLEFFAAHPEWNLVLAPHVRLFHRATAAERAELERYGELPNIRVDLGSERCIDMTYTAAADIYLGDVSSQVAEFLCRPRPCLFLNAHRVQWQGDPNYLFWTLGPVIESLDQLGDALRHAIETHGDFIEPQRQYMAETFDLPEGTSSAALGADAIVRHLTRVTGKQLPTPRVITPTHLPSR